MIAGGCGAQVQRPHTLPHHPHELLVDDSHQGLPGRQALVDLEPDRARLDARR